jgi:2,5-diamino-6-(ribosylamino)-4(3H)-pyrimidinone 5'-phosphate reductase
VDTVILTIAPVWLGQGGERICPPGSGKRVEVARLKGVKWVPMGEDVVLCGRMKGSE